jgi:soluble lytic murein transglycosylase
VRRLALASVLAGAVLLAGAAAVFWAKRTIRWNDARTMPPPLEAAVKAFTQGNDERGLHEVERLLERYRAPAWEPEARVLAARHLESSGRLRDILRVLPKELRADHPLATDALLLRARGLEATGRHADAAEAAGRAAGVAGFPRRDDALETRARALDAAGDGIRALDELERVPGVEPARVAAEIAIRHGQRPRAARRLAAAALAAEPRDVSAIEDAYAELFPDAAPRFDDVQRRALAERAATFLEDGSPQTAIALARLARPAGSAQAATPAEALVEALGLVKLGRGSEARPLLARARTGGPSERDGATYAEARWAGNEGRGGAWRSGMEALASRGGSPWRERALLDLARAIEGVPSRRTLEAYRRYRVRAGSKADPLALLREAWAAFDLGLGAEADAGFARALARDDAPDGVRITALYWQARRLEAAGRQAAAREAFGRIAAAYPNHYYGLLAARRAGSPRQSAPAASPPPVDPSRIGPAGTWLSAARRWVRLGSWDDASQCYEAAIASAPKEAAIPLAVEAAASALDAHAVSEAIAFAQRAIGDRDRARPSSIPRDLWRLLLPAPPTPALTAEARAAGLDPNFVAAVALQESGWNPFAISSAGARGLLQVMPDVGAELARRHRLAGFKTDDLFDPAVNVKLGTRHLADYVRRFGGSQSKALAAFNGGPARVERWSGGASLDDERFVERIPIPETRLYVKRVTTGARLYALAWPEGFPAAAK